MKASFGWTQKAHFTWYHGAKWAFLCSERLLRGEGRMSILKWYAGGQDRAEQAISILTELVADLKQSQQKMPLQQVLSDYIEAFRKKESAVPFILSRMNLDISSALKNNQIVLTVSESDKLDALMALANIRYGY